MYHSARRLGAHQAGRPAGLVLSVDELPPNSARASAIDEPVQCINIIIASAQVQRRSASQFGPFGFEFACLVRVQSGCVLMTIVTLLSPLNELSFTFRDFICDAAIINRSYFSFTIKKTRVKHNNVVVGGVIGIHQ